MENTPSVTIILKRGFSLLAAINCASKSSILLFAYLYLAALHKRTPSIIDAWFSESEIIASSLDNNGSKTPPLASKAAAYRIVSSQ